MAKKPKVSVPGMWLHNFRSWRIRNINNKNFLVLASILVGIISGLAAVLLKNLVHHIAQTIDSYSPKEYSNYLYILLPMLGILLTVLYVQTVRKGKLGRGIGNILYSIARRSGQVEKDKTHSHLITSALTVGFGGSAGLEAPIVVTGAALGSKTANVLRLTSRDRVLLLACGTAAGISAIFNSPIAGVIFALEVLLVEMSIPAFIPLLISSATATVVSKLLHNKQLFFLITDGWSFQALPFYILTGIITGLVSVYITRITLKTEGWLNCKKGAYKKAIGGGLVLGAMIFIFPPLYGEGYNTIKHLFSGNFSALLENSLFYGFKDSTWFILLFAGALILIKAIATSITIAAGGNGGIFATSMFTGAVTGFFCAFAANLTGLLELNTTNFIAVGMAGVLSGVIHAPLTAIFLIAEITGGYVLFVPLMIVSALSYFITRYYEPYTVYTKKLAEKGLLPSRDKDKTVLNLMDLKNVVEKEFIPIKPAYSLGDLLGYVIKSRRNIFPVVDDNNKLIGILQLDKIRELLFKDELYDELFVIDLMDKEFLNVDIDEEMFSVVDKFENTSVFNIPVTDKEGTYIGFISKSNIFTKYRHLIIEESKPLSAL